jgi:hypothetical protein
LDCPLRSQSGSLPSLCSGEGPECFFGSFGVGRAGFLERTEGSEIYLLAHYFDFGDIVATLRNPDSLCAKLGFRGTECPLLTICNFPQVCPSDVRPVPVDAGDYVLRPFTGHVQPRKATRLIQLPVHADLAMHVTRVNGTGNAATASIASGGPPMEHPAVGLYSSNFRSRLVVSIG